MAPRLSGQIPIFGVVFFVSKSLLGIEGQKKLEKFAIFTRKPRSHARILIYRTWPIDNIIMCMSQLCILGQGKLVMAGPCSFNVLKLINNSSSAKPIACSHSLDHMDAP